MGVDDVVDERGLKRRCGKMDSASGSLSISVALLLLSFVVVADIIPCFEFKGRRRSVLLSPAPPLNVKSAALLVSRPLLLSAQHTLARTSKKAVYAEPPPKLPLEFSLHIAFLLP